MGLSAMVQYLKDFVGWYQLDGALLEGKINRLTNVIQTQCIAIMRSDLLYLRIYVATAQAQATILTL